MDEYTSSARRGGRKGVPVGVKAAVLAILLLSAVFLGYCALCSWVGVTIPAGTGVELLPSGQAVDLSGLTPEEAETLLSQSIQTDPAQTLRVVCGGQSVSVSADVFAPDSAAMQNTLADAVELGQNVPFLARGFRYLRGASASAEPSQLSLSPSYSYTLEGEAQVDRLLADLDRSVSIPPVDPVYTVGDDSVDVVPGTPGAALSAEPAKAAILSAFTQGQPAVYLTLDQVDPAPVDLEEINQAVYVAPVPVGVDENGKTTPPVTGVSIDTQAAQAALDGAAPGEPVTIPLVYSPPDYTQAGENGLLYQDKLSECVTYVSGSSGRLGNVILAAAQCNGYVLLPGDVFDYNVVVGERTTARGFSPAPSYVGGLTVNTVGGGICQVSSSLYYCMVYANLQAVTRYNHAFAVGYVPDGLDATVSWGGPEFRFKNTTEFPIKIVAYVQDRTLTVQFYGTNPDGTYVKTERNQLSASSYTTIYKPDESIPQGTTKVSITPYSGRKVAVYRCLYAADGTLISRTLENTSNYSSRDKVILYNPADAASLGLESPEQNDPPAQTDPPAQSDPPVQTDPPAQSDPPAQTDPPAQSDPPAQADPPAQSDPPADPDNPPLVEITPAPEGGVPLD